MTLKYSSDQVNVYSASERSDSNNSSNRISRGAQRLCVEMSVCMCVFLSLRAHEGEWSCNHVWLEFRWILCGVIDYSGVLWKEEPPSPLSETSLDELHFFPLRKRAEQTGEEGVCVCVCEYSWTIIHFHRRGKQANNQINGFDSLSHPENMLLYNYCKDIITLNWL